MKYRKKPDEVEAIKWNGSNIEEVIKFCNDKVIVYHDQLLNGVKCDSYSISILTLEDVMRVDAGDYIIKDIKGECYPCKPDIFEMTYEVEHERSGCPVCGKQSFSIYDDAIEHIPDDNSVVFVYEAKCNYCESDVNIRETYAINLLESKVSLED